MSDLIIQYSSSTAWQSGIIRRLCHSPFSHVDLVMPGEGLLGASGEDHKLNDPGGVRIRSFNPWPYRGHPIQAVIKTDKADAITTLARSQIGKPFDNSALWGFLDDKPSARDWRAEDQWFCSELVIWACEQADLFPWPLVMPKDRVSPSDSIMLLNPFFDAATVTHFQNLIEANKVN